MNNIDRLTEQIFNDIFGQQINEALWGLFTRRSKDDKDKAKFISILERYMTKIYKVAKKMVAFSKDPKNNTTQTRPIAEAVSQKVKILEALCSNMYYSPYGKQITKHVDFSKISPPLPYNISKYGWRQMTNQNTGTIKPVQNWSLSELMSYASGGEQAFKSGKDALNDIHNRPVLPDKDGTINKDAKHQEELYRELLEKWTRKVGRMVSDLTYDLRAANYNLTRFPDIQQLVSTFKSQCTIFASTRKTAT